MLQLNLEQGCDIDCIHCRRNEFLREKKKRTKSAVDIKREIDRIAADNPKLSEIGLIGGGEPTRIEEFLDIAAYLRQKGIGFRVESNSLRFADISFLKSLKELGLLDIELSVYSMEESIQQYCGSCEVSESVTGAG